MHNATALPNRRVFSWAGVGYGIGAGALWGMVFVAPKLAAMFTPLELTIGRYGAYGLMSLVMIAPHLRRLLGLLGRDGLLALVWLSLTGNTLYFFLLTYAVQMGGVAISSLIVGFLPVIITIVGSRARGAVPLRRLAPSLLLCGGGGLCIGWQGLEQARAAHSWQQVVGMGCAVGALISWTGFALGNNHWLGRLQDVSAQQWNLLIGVMTGAQALVLIQLALWIGVAPHGQADWLRYAAISCGTSLLASIIGNALWNRMSRILPLTLSGQMILFETLFALIYGFIWEQRWPMLTEIAAFVLLVAGLATCLAAHRAPAAQD